VVSRSLYVAPSRPIIYAASNVSSLLGIWKTTRFAGIRSPTALTGARHPILY